MSSIRDLVISGSGAAMILAGLAARPASAVTVTFDPAAAGLAGTAFSFDALQGVEASRIDNTFGAGGSLTFVERGFLQITGIELGGASFVPPGLNSAYTLYFDFTATGGAPSIVAPGTLSSARHTLLGVNGASSFGFTANVASVNNNGNVPVPLLSVDLINGTIGSTVVNPDPLALDLTATLNGSVNPIAPGFLAGPAQPRLLSLIAVHASPTVTVLNGGAVFLVRGGPDTITFSVPEPTSLGLLAIALLGLAFRRRSESEVEAGNAI